MHAAAAPPYYSREAKAERSRVRAPAEELALIAAVSNCSEPGALFNHLIGAGKQRRRHIMAERLGSLEIDSKRLRNPLQRLQFRRRSDDFAGCTFRRA
jgi:hypothetical protein